MNPFKRTICIESERSIFGLAKQYIFTDGILIPNKAIKGNKLYNVTIIDPAYKIFSLTITTINDKLKYVHAHVLHPNINPETLLYCLAPHYKNKPYNDKLVYELLNVMKTYYLDTCFFDPMQIDKDQILFTQQPTIKFNGKGEVIYG